MKSWIAANSLLVREIDTPLPHAVIEKKFGPFILESFFMTTWMEDAAELNDYIKEKLKSTSCHRKELFIKSFACALKKLHDRGVYHADLKSNNILVTEEGSESWRFFFVDLDRVSFVKKLSFHQRANNLAQINASVSNIITPKNRLKFFHDYAQGTALAGERKKYYKKILEISRTKITEPYGITFKK